MDLQEGSEDWEDPVRGPLGEGGSVCGELLFDTAMVTSPSLDSIIKFVRGVCGKLAKPTMLQLLSTWSLSPKPYTLNPKPPLLPPKGPA